MADDITIFVESDNVPTAMMLNEQRFGEAPCLTNYFQNSRYGI